MTLFGTRIIADVISLKGDHQDGPSSNMTNILVKKKSKFGPRYPQREDDVKSQGKVLQTKGRAWNRSYPPCPQQEWTWSTPWSWISSLQNGETRNFCWWSSPVCELVVLCHGSPSTLTNMCSLIRRTLEFWKSHPHWNMAQTEVPESQKVTAKFNSFFEPSCLSLTAQFAVLCYGRPGEPILTFMTHPNS